ncbi:MAG: hypothetical protein IT181_03610 [Acidobacteria bacterium]|nr:hypothetical protein [Acidobacteriota bacterium]
MSHGAPRIAVRVIAAVPLLIAALVATASAQAAAPADPKAGSTRVSVEGCLTKERGAGTTSVAELYVLVVPTPHAAPAAPTGGMVPAPALPKMYVLRTTTQPPVPLDGFVNHRVKVEGASTDGATSAPLAGRSPEATPYQAPVATGSAGSGATGTPFDRTNLPTLVVTSITSLAATCR